MEHSTVLLARTSYRERIAYSNVSTAIISIRREGRPVRSRYGLLAHWMSWMSWRCISCDVWLLDEGSRG